MTPEKELEVMAFRESVKDCPYDDLVGKNRETILYLCDAALHLAAIEAAGDEEVDSACDGLMKAYRSLDDNLFHKSMNALADFNKSRTATIADLRANLGEATELLHLIYGKPMCDEMLDSEEGDRLLKFIAESEVEGG